MNVVVPIIGQETEEQKQLKQLSMIANSWPVGVFPVGHPNLPKYWQGKLLVDSYVEAAMQVVKLPDMHNASNEKLVEWAKHCWTLAILMVNTRPVGITGAPEAPKEESKDVPQA